MKRLLILALAIPALASAEDSIRATESKVLVLEQEVSEIESKTNGLPVAVEQSANEIQSLDSL
jgi:hypothetical protein